MRMKRFLSMFVAGAMALSLAACGGAASTSTAASASGSAAGSAASASADSDLAYIQGKGKMVIGYTVYADQVRGIFPEKEYITTPMKQEIDR